VPLLAERNFRRGMGESAGALLVIFLLVIFATCPAPSCAVTMDDIR